MRVSDVISNVTKQNKTWTSWRQGTKLRVRLSLANARFASLLSKVMYIIKRKFKCLSWIWLLFHLVKWKNVYFIRAFGTHEIYIFHFTRWNKSHIHSKHLNILYVFQLEGPSYYMVYLALYMSRKIIGKPTLISLFYIYSRTSMTRAALGPWKFVRDMGRSSHWGLIMA